ncbi:MAG TPA: dienelactone hydrolase family protein [Acidimicrobiales bacterium]|jgi:dienelactone hydrolase|nr:dienelactone hydrolase family protein [Acidimicrobiales bacterium]
MAGVASVVLYHSVLGVRPGVEAAAELMRSHGHSVKVVDQYGGRVFDDYDEARRFADSVGFPALMGAAAEAVGDVDHPIVVAGFSNGGGIAEYVAGTTPGGIAGALLLSGAIDPAMIGVVAWPATVPVQVHYTVDDPFRNQAWVDALTALVTASAAHIEVFDYPGAGHLFTDATMVAEYQPDDAALLWDRALEFLDRVAAPPS